MKRVFQFFLILAFMVTLNVSADITRDIEKLAENFSIQFRDANPNLVFKPNLGVLPFSNDSPDAEKYSIGEAVSGIIRSSFSRSLLFNLIDEQQREKAINEIKFALSGLGDSDRLEIGQLEGIDFFIYGSVTQIGDNFMVNMSAVEVNTSRIIFTDDITLPRYDIIDYSEKLAAAYVSPYGLGIEFHYTPVYHLTGEMADKEGQIVEGKPMGFSLNYRISRNIVAWAGMEFTAGAFRLKDTHESVTYDKADIQNMVFPEDPDVISVNYQKERTYATGFLGLGYVFNLSKTFNITLGGEAMVGFGFIQQFYSLDFDDGLEPETVIHSKDLTILLLSPVIKLQYYATPRVALNLGYKYSFNFAKEGASQFFMGRETGGLEYSPFTSFNGLRADIDPLGNSHPWDFSGHRVFAGVGFWF